MNKNNFCKEANLLSKYFCMESISVSQREKGWDMYMFIYFDEIMADLVIDGQTWKADWNPLPDELPIFNLLFCW